jgi:hypothetical protein
MSCTCIELDDDLIEAGSTCYHCYEMHKDNPNQCKCKGERK